MTFESPYFYMHLDRARIMLTNTDVKEKKGSKMNWDTIFTAGTHTDSKGRTRTWTENDLDTLVKNTGEDIPVVIRHPESEDSVTHFGKIARLRRVGNKLMAQYHSVPDALKKAVKEGLSLGKSVSIDRQEMAIRHLGLLGAGQPPAVPGLGPASFNAPTGKSLATYMFQREQENKPEEESMDKDKIIQELRDEIKDLKTKAEYAKKDEETQKALDEAKQKLAEEQASHQETKAAFSKFKGEQEEAALAARVDALAESGRIRPHEKEKTLAFAKALPAGEKTMEFSAADGTKTAVSVRENYLLDLEARPADKDGLLTEFAKNGSPAASEDMADFEDINSYA